MITKKMANAKCNLSQTLCHTDQYIKSFSIGKIQFYGKAVLIQRITLVSRLSALPTLNQSSAITDFRWSNTGENGLNRRVTTIHLWKDFIPFVMCMRLNAIVKLTLIVLDCSPVVRASWASRDRVGTRHGGCTPLVLEEILLLGNSGQGDHSGG